MRPAIALFTFTIRQTLLSRRIWLTVLLLAAPCGLLILVRCFGPPETRPRTLWEMYQVVSQFMLMMGLIPLVCMLHGTALIGADVEARTIAYLTTRRMRRATVLVVKFAATALVLAVLSDLAMLAVHLCVFTGRDMPSLLAHTAYSDWNPSNDLFCYLRVIPFAALGFLAVFCLIGLLTARPLAMSVFYLVTIELVLSNLPIRARVYSLTHQLRATIAGMVPRVSTLYEMPPDMRAELYPPNGSDLPELLGAVLVALALAGLLVTLRELVPTKVSRE